MEEDEFRGDVSKIDRNRGLKEYVGSLNHIKSKLDQAIYRILFESSKYSFSEISAPTAQLLEDIRNTAEYSEYCAALNRETLIDDEIRELVDNQVRIQTLMREREDREE